MFALRWAALLGLFLLAFASTGCGVKNVKINGKLLKNGQPMVVSEDTYVTLSFIPEQKATDGDEKQTSYSAKFEHKSGTYSVQMPAGKYRTMVVVVLPGRPNPKGKLNAPRPPVKSDKVHELTKDQQLDIEIPGK